MTVAIERAGRSVALTAHKAILSGDHHGNTISGIRECLDAGVSRLEIDIHSLDGPDYIIFHERRLQHGTTGSGSLGQVTPDDVRAVRFTADADDRPPLLSEVVEAAVPGKTQLQLDLKDWRPMAPDRIRTLLDVIAPIHDRIIVTTGQDWNLLRLHRADPDLALGFDPGHYLDHAIEGSVMFLPRNVGAYGYRDDHPMAVGRTEETADYLRERWALLRLQAPWAQEFFVNWLLMLQMLDDGFDVTPWLHEHSIAVTAWTPDYRGSESLRSLDRLIAAGVDRITTNTIPQWVAASTTS